MFLSSIDLVSCIESSYLASRFKFRKEYSVELSERSAHSQRCLPIEMLRFVCNMSTCVAERAIRAMQFVSLAPFLNESSLFDLQRAGPRILNQNAQEEKGENARLVCPACQWTSG